MVRDPASTKETRLVPEAALDSARQSFGTDEDLLFVSMRRMLAAGVESELLQQM